MKYQAMIDICLFDAVLMRASACMCLTYFRNMCLIVLFFFFFLNGYEVVSLMGKKVMC